MKISVKIADVEVIVDRPNFKEADKVESDYKLMRDVVLPTIKEAALHAYELYELKHQQHETTTNTI